MNIFSVLLVGLSVNLDNLCAAVALGLQQKRISVFANLIISLISGIVAFVASQAAIFLLPFHVAGILGSVMLACMGIWTIASSFANKAEQSMQEQPLDIWRTLLTGCALAVNCLPVAFAAGATGLSPLWISLFIAIFSFLSILVGIKLGNRLGHAIKAKWINMISGILLMLLALLQLLQ